MVIKMASSQQQKQSTLGTMAPKPVDGSNMKGMDDPKPNAPYKKNRDFSNTKRSTGKSYQSQAKKLSRPSKEPSKSQVLTSVKRTMGYK